MPVKVTNHQLRTYQIINQQNGLIISPTIYNPRVAVWADQLIGVSNPNYKQVIRQGGNATTDAVGTRQVNVLSGSGHAILDYTAFGVKHVLEISGYLYASLLLAEDYPTVSSYGSNSADKQARLAFLSNYRQARTAFQSGTFFGELAEAVRMLKSPVQAFRQGINRYYRAVTKRVGRKYESVKAADRRAAQKLVYETWLEYSYGWIPLLNDARDALSVLDASPQSYREVITGFGKEPIKAVRTVLLYDLAKLHIKGIFNTVGMTTVRYKGAVRGDISPPAFSEQIGGNLSNFLPTVWNLIPYSFLVDYFTNVGKVIDGASLGTVSLAWGERCIRKNSKVTKVSDEIYNLPPPPDNTVNIQRVSGFGYSSETTQFVRTSVPSVGVGLADLSFRVPGISSTKWLNIAGLAGMRSLKHF